MFFGKITAKNRWTSKPKFEVKWFSPNKHPISATQADPRSCIHPHRAALYLISFNGFAKYTIYRKITKWSWSMKNNEAKFSANVKFSASALFHLSKSKKIDRCCRGNLCRNLVHYKYLATRSITTTVEATSTWNLGVLNYQHHHWHSCFTKSNT